jgi:hypothetical protein
MTTSAANNTPFTTARVSDLSSLPTIYLNDAILPTITDLAWQALIQANGDRPYLFTHGGVACRVDERLERTEDGQILRTPVVATLTLTVPRMKFELMRAANWIYGKANMSPSNEVIQDVLATPRPPLPPLTRITQVPVFAADGTLETEPGYHKHSQTYYWATGAKLKPVSDAPSREEVTQAKKLIPDDLLGDFPFADQSSKAHAVALVLLPYVRNMIYGPTPNHLIEAPSPGSGKGLLVDACLRPAVPALSSATPAHSDEEWRRRLTGCFREHREVIFIDNVNRDLDSAALASAMTQLYWEDRILGTNENPKFPIHCIWVMTANNPTMSLELARRSIKIRLDPQVERPWLKEGFQHPDLRGWIEQKRAGLIWAAHTLVQAWIRAGRPQYTGKVLGSYERWSAVIGGILEFHGIPGFLQNLTDFYEIVDTEVAGWRTFVSLWAEEFGEKEVTAADLLPCALKAELDLGPVPDASQDSGGARVGRAQKIAFGKLLMTSRDRVIGEYKITLAGRSQRVARWRLVRCMSVY